MYGCACSDCYLQCADTLCNSNTPEPNAACVSCIKATASNICHTAIGACTADTACAAYMTCAHGCP
jgi:hypothetical protein